MPKVPFSFTLDGTDDYGTPFVATDDAFGTHAVKNTVLDSILAASQVYKTFGVYLPPTDIAYKITGLHEVKASDTADVTFGIYDGANFVSLYTLIAGAGEHDFGDGFVVSAGYIPAFHYEGNTNETLTGQVSWSR